MSAHGVVAQLVDHLHGIQGVVGSSPISSTKVAKDLVGTLDDMQHASRRFESDQLHHEF